MATAIGITGQMGSGKTRMAETFAGYLSRKNIRVRIISVDRIRRHLMTASPGHVSLRENVSRHFGVPLEAGAFDLQRLAAAVFREDQGPPSFWRLAGGDIVAAAKEEMRGDGFFLLEWARLVEDGFLPLLAGVIVTDCAPAVRQRRLANGDLPPEQVRKRVSLQMSAADVTRALKEQSKKFWIFDTTGSPDAGVYHKFYEEVLHEIG